MRGNELLSYIFDGQPHILAAPITRWLAASPRFRAFVTEYRDKIRKKLRTTEENEALRDLLFELETAYLLLQEQRFALTYEPFAKGKLRGPDFAVTFKTILTFAVEVTRIRSPRREEYLDPLQETSTQHEEGARPHAQLPQLGSRLTDSVCNKLGQLQPGMSNLLVIVVDSTSSDEIDLRSTMQRLKERAERKEQHLFTRHGWRGPSDFFKSYLRLSMLLMWTDPDDENRSRVTLWENPQAKYPLPANIRTLLQQW